MAETARLGLPLIAAEQALKHVTHNEAMEQLGLVVQLAVEEQAVDTPPGSPTSGACYQIGAAATGDWAGHDGELAIWTEGGWRYATPEAGWQLWDKDTSTFYLFDGSDWVELGTSFSAFQNLAMLGVNAAADATNKLSVRSNAALFNALDSGSGGSGDIRLTLNRESGSDTASLVFQSAWSGRAEIGIAGSDDFTFRVSPDGSSFHTGISLDKDNGYVTLNKLFGTSPSYPTISAGVLTISSSYAIPAPESGTADTVDTISGGFDGAILIVTGTAGNTLTFSDGTGNLKLNGNRVLDNFEDSLMLVQRGSDWIELCFSDNG